MSPTALRRIAWLAGVTVVVAVAALALARRDAGGRQALPEAVTVAGSASGYYTARAAPYSPTPQHRRTDCGDAFTPDLQGVADPVLPCGVKIYIRYRGHEVLTQIVDRGPGVAGHNLELTKALADRIGLHGTQTIQWRYAR